MRILLEFFLPRLLRLLFIENFKEMFSLVLQLCSFLPLFIILSFHPTHEFQFNDDDIFQKAQNSREKVK
jgi:hypothetical protein